MEFYVIYEFNVPVEYKVKEFQPPFMSRFSLMECWNERHQWHSHEGENYKHRQYAGTLTKKQFDVLVKKQWLTLDSVSDEGRDGLLPAFSFGSEDAYYGKHKSASVVPYITKKGKITYDDCVRVKIAMLSVYK